jgi:hypothetical protein
MVFSNFEVNQAVITQVKANMLHDIIELLPSGTPEVDKEDILLSATTTLDLALRKLARLDTTVDPLTWWPSQQEQLGILFPLAKMLFAIPATSADNERAFSSAGFTLDIRRSRLDLEVFRREHRIRRFFVAGTDAHSAEARQLKLDRLNDFLEYYVAQIVNGLNT